MNVAANLAATVKFAPRRPTHVTLFIGDHDRSRAFYHKVCGFEPVYYEEPVELTLFSNGSSHHDLAVLPVKYKSATRDAEVPKPGLNHIAWELENERALVEAYNRALAAKVEIQRTLTHTVSHSVYIFDPDGNLHEFYSDATENWRTTYHGGSGGSVTSQWNPNGAPADTRRLYPDGRDIRVVAEAALHPRRLTQIVLVTKNHEAMVEFCTGVAGMAQTYASPNLACFSGSQSPYPSSLALVRGDGRSAGFHHASFEVGSEGELAAGEAKLAAAGVAIERKVDSAAKRSLFVRDPDGIRFEYAFARKPDFAAAAAAPLAERAYLV